MAMLVQVQDLLKDAMGLIGAVEIDETPSSTEMAVALRTANIMIDRWSSQSLLLRSDTDKNFNIAYNATGIYSIGIGQTLNGPKPIDLTNVQVRDLSNNDYPVQIINKSTYDTLNDKLITTGRPMYIAYDPGEMSGTFDNNMKGDLFIYPLLDQPYTLVLSYFSYLNEFVNFTDKVYFEPAYYEALIYNIAVRLYRRYHDDKTQIPVDIVSIANNSLQNIKTMNSVQLIAGMDVPGKTSVYNVYTDSVD